MGHASLLLSSKILQGVRPVDAGRGGGTQERR